MNYINCFASITAREGQSARKRNVKRIPHHSINVLEVRGPNVVKICKNARHSFVVRISRE